MTKNPKRPRDPAQLAKRIVDIAVGAEPRDVPHRDTPAAEMGRKGGAARAAKLSPERRSNIAKAAADKRWKR